jgi:hypothetical protein
MTRGPAALCGQSHCARSMGETWAKCRFWRGWRWTVPDIRGTDMPRPRKRHFRTGRQFARRIYDRSIVDRMIAAAAVLVTPLPPPKSTGSFSQSDVCYAVLQASWLPVSAQCRFLWTEQRMAARSPLYRISATPRTAAIMGEAKTSNNRLGFERGLWHRKTMRFAGVPKRSVFGLLCDETYWCRGTPSDRR